MPALSVDDLPRYRLALDRAVRAWGLLADHVRARLTAAFRRAHGVVLKDGFAGGPEIPRSFTVACGAFREAFRELHDFGESPPAFPWPQWGEQALAPTGPLPDLEGWLDSLGGIDEDDWHQRVIGPFLKHLGVVSLHFQGFMECLDRAKEKVIAASENPVAISLRADKAIRQALVEEHERGETERAQRRQRLRELFTALLHAISPTNEPTEEWARRVTARLLSVGQEVKAQGWEDWLRENAVGKHLTCGLVEQMLNGDQGGMDAVVRELRDFPSELSYLVDWLKTLQRDWSGVFDQGWLWWTLTKDLVAPEPQPVETRSSEGNDKRGRGSADRFESREQAPCTFNDPAPQDLPACKAASELPSVAPPESSTSSGTKCAQAASPPSGPAPTPPASEQTERPPSKSTSIPQRQVRETNPFRDLCDQALRISEQESERGCKPAHQRQPHSVEYRAFLDDRLRDLAADCWIAARRLGDGREREAEEAAQLLAKVCMDLLIWEAAERLGKLSAEEAAIDKGGPCVAMYNRVWPPYERVDHLARLYDRVKAAQASSIRVEAAVDKERLFMEVAIQEARQSVGEDGRAHPKVGAVVVKDGIVLASAHRGELGKGEHAEYTALEKKLPNETVAGATVYTTLEPCTTRNHPKIPCAKRLIERKVERVVIGMLDPNPAICGKGERFLREHGIVVDRFPHDLILQLEELNRNFTRGQSLAARGKITVPLLPLLLELLRRQGAQGDTDRSQTPWIEALSHLFPAMKIPLTDERNPSERLARSYLLPDEPTGDESALREYLLRVRVGAVRETSLLSAELARLDGEGFGDRLAESLRQKYPEEMQEILATIT